MSPQRANVGRSGASEAFASLYFSFHVEQFRYSTFASLADGCAVAYGGPRILRSESGDAHTLMSDLFLKIFLITSKNHIVHHAV